MVNLKKQKGVSIVYIVLITSVIFAIALGINSISYQQARTMNEQGYSVVAFFAADAGAERQLYNLYKQSINLPEPGFSLTFVSSVPAGYVTNVWCSDLNTTDCFGISKQLPAGSCLATNFCVNSVGEYREIRRAVELKY